MGLSGVIRNRPRFRFYKILWIEPRFTQGKIVQPGQNGNSAVRKSAPGLGQQIVGFCFAVDSACNSRNTPQSPSGAISIVENVAKRLHNDGT